MAAWRALPLWVRRRVVTLTREGSAVPDAAAAEIGRRYAVASLTPRGPHWWQRHRWHPAWTPVLGGLAVLLFVASYWLHSRGVPWKDLWGGLLLGGFLLLFAGMNRSLRRTLRALAARAPAEPTELSGERSPPA